MQRVLAREALGKLHAIGELFGIEDHDLAREQSAAAFNEWDKKLREFESWIWDESPIA